MVEFYSKRQAPAETVVSEWTLTDTLYTGGSITGGSATHTPPSGSAGTTSVLVSSPRVFVSLSGLTVTGTHTLEARAAVTNAGGVPNEVLAARWHIQVDG